MSVGAVLAEISTNGDAPVANNGGGVADAVPAGVAGPVSGESPPVTPEEAVAGAATEAEGVAAAQASTGELIDIVTPTGGESVTEGTIVEWSVKVGDAVKEGQTVVEISTDKVDMELPAPASGTIAEILFADGDTVKVGQVIARMAAGAAAAPVPLRGADGRRRQRARRRSAPAAGNRTVARFPTAPTSPRWRAASPPSRVSTSRHSTAPPGADGSPRPTCSRRRPTAATAPAPRPPRGSTGSHARQARGRPTDQGRRGRARPLHGREPLDPDRDLVPHAHGHHARPSGANN